MKNKKMMIIDGSSLLYRAFYALPLLSNKKGVYTNGIHGFLTMLYKVTGERKPDYLCVVFDKKGPTFRVDLYEDYKGHRQATPTELAQQFPIIRGVLDAMNVKYLEITGFEADDIAGTLAKKAEENNIDVTLVTGDKDYLQLATDNIQVLITKKGITDLEEYNREKVIEKYEITPAQLIDLKGLMGDQSDNIPGVPGVGEKTGLKLLKEYGSVENIYENIDNISGKKLKENLVENKQLAFLSKKLGEIVTSVPLDIELEDLKVEEAKSLELESIYRELELNTLLSKIGTKANRNEELSKSFPYQILNRDNYKDLIEQIKKEKRFAFKFIVENGNYLVDDILSLGIKINNKDAYIIHLEALEKFSYDFKEIFEDINIEKVGYNIKQDILVLFRLGVNIENIKFDPVIAQYLLNPSQSSYSINHLSNEYLNIYGVDEEELIGKGKSKKTYREIENVQLENHLAFILNSTLELEKIMIEEITDKNMLSLYEEIELPLAEVLASMEFYGFKIDVLELQNLSKEYDGEINTLTNEIYDLAGVEFNINSPKKLGEVLFDTLKLPVIKKTKTGYSTDVEVLEKLYSQHPIIEKILRYRQIVKLKSTYIDGLLNVTDNETERVHSSFNQTITTTGRISSTEPNLQNIPIRTEDGRRIRKAFIAENNEYILVDADYSQIELRVLAHISDDPKMKEAFINNEDIHTKTASEVFNVPKDEVTSLMRSRAKAVNFGIVYGISDYGLSRDLNISRKEAKEYIDNYLLNYANVQKYMEDIVEEGKTNGYVETIMHRRRYIPELTAKNFNIKGFGERIAMNTPIQGSAADIIKMAMIKVYKEIKDKQLESRLVLQIHDELIIETKKHEEEEVKEMLKNIMENSVTLSIPLVADLEVGDSWYDTK